MSGPFKLKYKNSAFPFKSPLKHPGPLSRTHKHLEDGTIEYGEWHKPKIPRTTEQHRKEWAEKEREMTNPKNKGKIRDALRPL